MRAPRAIRYVKDCHLAYGRAVLARLTTPRLRRPARSGRPRATLSERVINHQPQTAAPDRTAPCAWCGARAQAATRRAPVNHDASLCDSVDLSTTVRRRRQPRSRPCEGPSEAPQ